MKHFIKHQNYSGNNILELKINLAPKNTRFMNKMLP